jgi:polar amino acid transport system substrate-binding protein
VKHRYSILFSLIALLLLGFLVYGPIWAPEAMRRDEPEPSPINGNSDATLVFGSDVWAPFISAPEAEQAGYMVDIVRALFESEGYAVRFVVLPWSRCLEEARSGRITGVLGAEVVDAPNFIFPQEVIARSRASFYVRDDIKWHYEGPDSLSHVKLGYIQDYGYPLAILDYIEGQTDASRLYAAHGEAPLDQLIEALKAKRIDAFIEFTDVADYKINQLDLGESIRYAGCAATDAELFIAFSPVLKTSTGLARIFDDNYRAMLKRGDIERMLQQYGLPGERTNSPSRRERFQTE